MCVFYIIWKDGTLDKKQNTEGVPGKGKKRLLRNKNSSEFFSVRSWFCHRASFPMSAPSCSTFAPLCERETRADAPLTRVLCRQTRGAHASKCIFSSGGVPLFYTQPHHRAPASWHQLLSAHFRLPCARLRTQGQRVVTPPSGGKFMRLLDTGRIALIQFIQGWIYGSC